jgi:hypothetical protein
MHLQARPLFAALLAAALAFPPLSNAKVKPKTIKSSILVFPQVSVKGIDYSSLHAQFAFGASTISRKEKRTTEIPCAPRNAEGRTSVKDTKMLPIHYYRLHYKMPPSYLVIKKGNGEIIHAAQLGGGEETWEDFGKKNCGHMSSSFLEKNWQKAKAKFMKTIEKSNRKALHKRASRHVTNAVFFKYEKEKFKLSYAADKKHNYADLDKAFMLAKGAYDTYRKQGYNQKSLDALENAVPIWKKALEEADIGNKRARINRKVALRLHENVGVASMFANDFATAMAHLAKADSLKLMKTSTTGGTGIGQVMDRVRQRKKGYEMNKDLSLAPNEIARLLKQGKPYRGKIKIKVLPRSQLSTLAAEYNKRRKDSLVDQYAAAKEDEAAAVATGVLNPYDKKVTHTAMQGFMLILRPIPFMASSKLASFPDDVCGLTQLNQLDMVGHGFSEVPACIGKLRNLKKLNLSKNKLSALPESIGNLKNLKKLTLKKNKFSKSEQKRIRGLLPDTKIKF